MSLIVDVPEPNLWEEICKEFARKRPPFPQDPKPSIEVVNYDASKASPIFYGKAHLKVSAHDVDTNEEFDPAASHPACIGYTFIDEEEPETPPPAPATPDKKKCSPREYLETYVFPHLLPAIEAMLVSAKKERCFERKRTKFNALDFLTEYLYKNNPNKTEARKDMTLFDIPFVQKRLAEHPRPPLPLSLIWTEEEATQVIQSHLRGYLVRRQPEIQELRVWQKEWREENANIRNKVDDFWADKLPAGGDDADDTTEGPIDLSNDD